jgi:hypothetical protein
VTPFLSFLGAAALVAAPAEPGAAGKTARYQKLADGLAWKEPADQPTRSLHEQLPGYMITCGQDRGVNANTDSVRIVDAGTELCSWEVRGAEAYLARRGVLYRADYSPILSGCAITAVDLTTGKNLWTVDLKGLGPIGQSEDPNRVWMEPVADGVLAVYGRESGGRYVELVDLTTGRTVGHKVFPPD